jgi:hypothetical protein
MPDGDYTPQKAGELVPWLENFIPSVNTNLATLRMISVIKTNLTSMKDAYATDFNASPSKQAESKAPTEKKNISKTNAIKGVRIYAKQIQANGTNTLKWIRNGNPQNTIFIIKSSHAASMPSQIAGSTTKTTFEHLNQVSCFTLFCPVKAQRNELISPLSNGLLCMQRGRYGESMINFPIIDYKACVC